jgi:GTPase
MTINNINSIVTILGRPNVGKSSLFNRICGENISIVHESEGVTRDRVVKQIVRQDKLFTLIDTAGLLPAVHFKTKPDDNNEILSGVKQQITFSLAAADTIIFTTDIQKGLLPVDEEIAAFLRKSNKHIILAANKADNFELEQEISSFLKVGFPVFAVSALHSRGINELLKSVLANIPQQGNNKNSDSVKIAVTGRPNVGKSSLINRIVRDDRMVVSGVPGTTRDSVDIHFRNGSGNEAQDYILIDTSGIRRKKRDRTNIDNIAIYKAKKSIKQCDVAILVLDAVQGPSSYDKKIAHFIMQHQKGCVIMANKWDLMKDITYDKYNELLKQALPFLDFAPMVTGSAKTGFNVKRVLETAEFVAAVMTARIPTRLLNKAVSIIQNDQPQRMLKILYAVQIKANPIKIALFVNRPQSVTKQYLRYLAKRLRIVLDLKGVPLFFDIRGRNKINSS